MREVDWKVWCCGTSELVPDHHAAQCLLKQLQFAGLARLRGAVPFAEVSAHALLLASRGYGWGVKFGT